MDIVSIVLAVGTVLGGGGSAFLWLETRGERGRNKRKTEVNRAMTEAIAPMQTQIATLHIKFDTEIAHTDTNIKVVIQEALAPVRDQISTLNTKIEPLWKVLETLAINQIPVLHQPDPRRAEIDTLLEKLKAELTHGVMMSEDDFNQLRYFLLKIQSWEPGQNIGFPVLPAEPTSAAILLSIMGISRQRRRQEH